MFHSFFNSLVKSRYLSFFSHSFSFILWSAGTAKSVVLHWSLSDSKVFHWSLGDSKVFHWSLSDSKVFHWSLGDSKVFHWSLSDSKSPQISRTLLSILTDFTCSEVLMVPILPLISDSYSLFFTEVFGEILNTLARIDKTVTLMFHNVSVLWQGSRICPCFRFFYFHSVVRRIGKVYKMANSLFF